MKTKIRIGNGFDAHRFTEGNYIVLGGVTIPHSQALLAHSDGDVVLHALCDAILGALGKGDIGKHFPDSDARYKNIDSRQLLRHVADMMQQEQYTVNNLDITIIAQQPKMAAHVATMQTNIAEDLCAAPEQVNIKATTTEQMGFTGRGEGIAVMASVLLTT